MPLPRRVISSVPLRLLMMTDAVQFLVFPFMLFLGVHGVWEQHVQMTTWRPAWAEAVTAPGDDFGRPRPVALRYEVDGRSYKHWSKKVDNYDRAARRVVDDAGGRRLQVELLYNPREPREAVVGRFYRFGPYFFLGMSALLVGGFTPMVSTMVVEPFGGEAPRSRRRHVADAIIALPTVGVGAAGLLHFFAVSAPPYNGGAKTWTTVYIAIALALLAWLVSRAAAWGWPDVRLGRAAKSRGASAGN